MFCRYKLEMSSDNGVSWQPLRTSIDGLSYVVKNVASLNGYQFRVAASNLYSSRCGTLGGICGQSPWTTSDIINAMSGLYSPGRMKILHFSNPFCCCFSLCE